MCCCCVWLYVVICVVCVGLVRSATSFEEVVPVFEEVVPEKEQKEHSIT